MSSADTYAIPTFRNETRPSEVITSGRVLIIKWVISDIPSTAQETGLLRQLFCDGFRYDVEDYSIPLNHSVAAIRAKLHSFFTGLDAATLAIVYYKGHGGLNFQYNNELYFTSHGRQATGPLSAAPGYCYWSEIRDLILAARSEVLTILDCCHAGGANLADNLSETVAQTPASYSSKYLIAACGFETISWSLMLTPYLCSVLWDSLRSRSHTQVNCQDLHREVTSRLQHQNTVVNGQWISKNLVCYKLAPPDPPSGPLPAIALPILNDQYVSERRVTDGGSQWYWGRGSEAI